MRKLIIVIALALLPLCSGAQDFKKYTDMNGVSSMVMTSEMFKLLADIDIDSQDPEVKRYLKLIDNLDDIKVLSTEDPKIGSKMKVDVDKFLSNSPLKELMRFNDDGKNVGFYSSPGSRKGSVSKLLMFLTGKENGKPRTVIMSINGDIDLKEVSKLAQDLNVPGAKELEKLNTDQ